MKAESGILEKQPTDNKVEQSVRVYTFARRI